MDLELYCDYNGFDNVRFSRRGNRGLIVDVTRSEEDNNVLLSDKDVERLYEYIGEYLGKGKESVYEVLNNTIEDTSELLDMSFRCTSAPYDVLDTCLDETDTELYMHIKNDEEFAALYLSVEDALTMAENIIKAFGSVGVASEPVIEKPSLSIDEAFSELQHNFYCATEDGSHLAIGYDLPDKELTLELTEDDNTTFIYLKAEDAMKLSESIKKVFGTNQNNTEPHYMRPFKDEPVVEEHEDASKEDLDKVAADFRSDMTELKEDLDRANAEITQLQKDIFNTNERLKVTMESLGKQTENVSKEFTAALEHLATRIDENSGAIHSLKVNETLRELRGSGQW